MLILILKMQRKLKLRWNVILFITKKRKTIYVLLTLYNIIYSSLSHSLTHLFISLIYISPLKELDWHAIHMDYGSMRNFIKIFKQIYIFGVLTYTWKIKPKWDSLIVIFLISSFFSIYFIFVSLPWNLSIFLSFPFNLLKSL